ncbi:LysM domain [Sesbania bispinosa]|nr:LysM domain [Sesbania bispinosa]
MTTSCIKPHHPLCVSLLLLLLFPFLLDAQTPRQENNTGFTCTVTDQNRYPCQAYAFYRASSPNFLDLASIADLFSVSRLMISNPSNISNPSSPLVPNQPLLIPLTCSCNRVNTTFGSLSYANISYTIKPNDTYFIVSTFMFQNLTTYPSVEVVNPTLVATNLSIGVNVIFPIFCMCPNRTTQDSANYMISYVVQPSDNISSIASSFGSREQSIIDVNGDTLHDYDTIFVPVTRLPVLSQPTVVPSAPPPGNGTASGSGSSDDRTGTVRGLAIGLGIVGLLLILVIGLWVYREVVFKDRLWMVKDEEQQRQRNLYLGGKGSKENKEMDVKLMANVSDCLDKYRVFGIEELIEATDGFSENCLIQGSVYKGSIDGEVYAIKKMKWNAYEELKILQKIWVDL